MQDKKTFLTRLIQLIEDKNPRFLCSDKLLDIFKKINKEPDVSLKQLTDDELQQLSRNKTATVEYFKSQFNTDIQQELSTRCDDSLAEALDQKPKP